MKGSEQSTDGKEETKKDPAVKASIQDQRKQRKEAIKKTNELISLLREETSGKIDLKKPSDVIRLLFENVNSIGVF